MIFYHLQLSKIRITGIIFILVLVLPIITAAVNNNIVQSIDLNQYNFTAGETVIIETLIQNNVNEKMHFIVQETLLFPNNSIPPTPNLRAITLDSGENQLLKFPFYIYDITPSGTYTYNVDVKTSEIIEKNTISFNVYDTFKPLDAYLRTCADPECNFVTGYFYPDEDKVYIKIYNVQNAKIDGTVLLPNEKENILVFENGLAQSPINGIGSYKVIITVEKEGYKSELLETKYEVRNKELDIEPKNQKNIFIPMILALSIILLILILIIIKTKNNKP